MKTYQINRRTNLISIIIKPFKTLLKSLVLFVALPVDLLTHILEPLVLSSRALAKKYNGISPDDKSGQNHKHDNYQSQIDMLTRRLNNYVEILDEKFEGAVFCFEENKKDINELQLSLESISDKLNSHIDLVEARQINTLDIDLDVSAEHQLKLLEGEAMYHDAVREAEPDFHAEQKALAKQIAKVNKLDEDWEEYQRDSFENPEPLND
tara:strand:- start:378 stop:1004 length:627 start_codon:yes stop_codon:yes gene_type:complete